MGTEKLLIETYGPLLSLDELAQILKRSRDGLRLSLRSNSEFASTWSSARIKIGKRVYFRSADVARLISSEEHLNG